MDRRKFLKGMGTGLGALFASAAIPAWAQQAVDLVQRFTHATLASPSTEDVGVRLVCLFDVSGSVDSVEHDVQLQAMADAIASDDFRKAVYSRFGPQSIALCVADFSADAALRMGWTDFRKGDDAKFITFANELRKLPRRTSSYTNQIAALDFAAKCLENCKWGGKRHVVDMITDGQDSDWGVKNEVKELAEKHSATVNALVTIDTMYPNIEEWAWKTLVTPPGFTQANGLPLDAGFVKVVATQLSTESPGAVVKYRKAMELAFRRKLILEVAGMELEDFREAMKAEEGDIRQGNRPMLPPERKPEL